MKNIFPLVFLLLFLYNAAFSGINDSAYYLNPEKIIAESIFTHKITMLGEGTHHVSKIQYNLIYTLNNWSSLAGNNENLNSNLTLVLECDSTTAELMNYYVQTGDLKPFVDFTAPDIALEDLELLYELRKLQIKNTELNKSKKNKINLEIKGFEEIGYNIKEDYYNLKQREQELWFVNSRDEYTSKGIINYIKRNQDKNILIYYGSAHLQSGITNKKCFGLSLEEDECNGKWIRQYLEDEFGKKDIEAYESIQYRKALLGNHNFKATEKNPVLVTNSDSLYDILLPGISKYIINVHEDIPQHNLNYVMSKYIIDKAIDKISKFEKFSGYKAGSGMVSLYYGWLLHGIKTRKSDELRKWYDENGYFGPEFLDTKEFHDRITKFYFSNLHNYYAVNLLFGSGLAPELINKMTDSLDWENRVWPESLKDIKFINNVGIYWVGYPDEKEKAKQFLKEFSGKDFNEPAEYLQWWRREYKGYSI